MPALAAVIPPRSLAWGEVSLRYIRQYPGEVSKGFVPWHHFQIIAENGDYAGHINLRVGDTEHVRLYSGHIGYEVTKTHRGRGYALQACRALAPFVRSFYAAVIITADPDNAPSLRTIEKLGGRFIGQVDVPPHDPHYLRGSRRKLRYEWTP